jgi:glycosyltransferase involved in cell wall biosynthesis
MDRCWAFTLAYQEEALIKYWCRHYRTFCERYVVYVDAASNDRTAAVAYQYGAEVFDHETGGLDDEGFVAFAREHYPEARGHADWVVWVDADEFLYHPHLGRRLAELRAQGVTRPHVQGYQMVADAPPSGSGHIYDEITRGLPANEYSKTCVFDPGLDVAWQPGKHHATVMGADVRDDGADPLKLLHYRYLGEEWLVARNARNFARMGEAQKGRRHGLETYPDYAGVYSPAWYAEQTANAQEVVGP